MLIHQLYVLHHHITIKKKKKKTRIEVIGFLFLVTLLIADASLFVDDIPCNIAEFSFESFLTANGVEEAIPFTRLVELAVDDDVGGKTVGVVKDFFDGS